MVEKTVDVETKAKLQLSFGIREINFRCLKSYRPSAKKEKDKAIWDCEDENKDKDKTKSHNSCLLTQVSLKLRLSKKTNIMEAAEGAIKPFESMLLKLLRKTRTRPKIWAILSALLVNRKATIPTSATRRQNISGGLGSLYIND